MNTNKRMHALFVIGSDTLPTEKLHATLDNINQKYGGCTVHWGQGCWSEEGEHTLDNYSNVKFESAYQIEVCTELDTFDLEYLKRCFKPVSKHATWIHCETWITEAHHFNVKALD